MLVRLKVAGILHGRVVNHLGEPVADTRRIYAISRTFGTDADEKSPIEGILPGTYYLGANIWGQNHPRQSTLPQVLYPGVMYFKSATPIVIGEDGRDQEITFRLPDLGNKTSTGDTVVGVRACTRHID
jgi:hypothetical protein